ncbi:hypothetical protein C0993_009760 [Termitomyces sp. T159_Od127]|nr:hypothetical protein C0993_009760 [Termitomyces sp. T159_Od127]
MITFDMPLHSAKGRPLKNRFKWLLCAICTPVVLLMLRAERLEAEVKNVEFNIHQDDGATYTSLNLSAPMIPALSLTAILPVNQNSLSSLEEALKSLLGPSQLREIILLCPYANLFQTRSAVQKIVSSYPNTPDIRLQTVQTDTDARFSGIRAATQLSGWVLILDQDGLVRENSHSRSILLQPPALSFPYGPKGVCFSWFNTLEPCMRRSVGFPQEAHHLLPPFVMPAALATENGLVSSIADPWSRLGESIAATRADGIGGVVFGTDVTRAVDLSKTFGTPDNGNAQLGDAEESASGVFVVILPTFEDLRQLSSLLCMLENTGGHRTDVWVYGAAGVDGRLEVSDHCTLFYKTLLLSDRTALSSWFQTLATQADVILSLQEDKRLTSLATDPMVSFRKGSVAIRLFRNDLPNTEWMGSLSLLEWKSVSLSR